MAESLISILEKLDDRIKRLKEQNEELRQTNERLTAENSDLIQKARKAEEARSQAILDVEYLAVSHKLADNPDTLITARRQINQLIRNIDRCIEMLKD